MNYYKIIDTPLASQMDKYLQECLSAVKAAEALAVTLGAESFVPSAYGEEGGIMACSFARGKVPHFFRFAGETDGVRYYEPAVTVTSSVETEGFVRGIERRQNCRHWFDIKEISFEQAKQSITYHRAAELAHVKPSEHNLSSLSDKYRISPAWLELYHIGRMDFSNLSHKSANHSLREIDRKSFNVELGEVMAHERALTKALMKHKFYHVCHVYGTRDAVSFFRAASQLPVVPSGTLFSLLGVKFVTGEMSTPAFFKEDGHWYVGTSGIIDNDKVVEISEAEYVDHRKKYELHEQ